MPISSDLDYSNSSRNGEREQDDPMMSKASESEIYDKLFALFVGQVPGFSDKLTIWEQVNSLQVYATIPLIEQAFGVEIFSVEITGPNFNSVENLARLLHAKQKVKDPVLV